MSKKKHNEAIVFLKKNWNWIVLIAILFFGFYLRSYHLDYPVIGYHNWKEVHYLTEARNFARDGFFKHGFFVPAWDYPNVKNPSSGVHGDTFPTTSILIGVLFKFFGAKIVVARIFNIIICMMSIAIFYMFLRIALKREDVALTGSFLFAINPLHVFFGRNTQLINIALFFMLLAGYFYFKWLEDKKNSNLIVAVTLFMLSFITKYSFFVLAIPILLTIPFKKELKKLKKNWKALSTVICIILIFGFIAFYLTNLAVDESTTKSFTPQLIKIKTIFTKNFWDIQKSYLKDDFTLSGTALSIIGLLILVLKKNKTIGEKFFARYFYGGVLWFFIMSYKLSGHNYHYYPLIPLVILGITYFIMFVGVNLKNLTGFKIVHPLLIILISLMLFFPSVEAKDRMFNTQFFGLDIAGDYIRTHKLSGERVMHSSHQAYGLLWHGDIKGTAGIPKLEDIKFAEDNLNATWVFIYNWDFAKLTKDRERWNYIANNYRIVQTAFSATQNQLSNLYYFLLRKEGSFNESLFGLDGNLNIQVFSEIVNSGSLQTKEYEFTFGKQTIQYINLE
ncbi:hypothetical protein CMO90_02000 [Candidatus Woesearchaeota archaeon]|jgi:4-amino-4-deoxy-L-arabinose transferase-like glycosyltransferase|nr:hypothetical protein [Candidatus Woesearchaeota archaeon]|tara:strand:+ start:4014 stop:5696 length:1683 start_codon:yes stop_codon:yes gene_type:complete